MSGEAAGLDAVAKAYKDGYEAARAEFRNHIISDPDLHALHECAKGYTLANRALREAWGYTHSTSLAYLIEQGLIGPTSPAYAYSVPSTSEGEGT